MVGASWDLSEMIVHWMYTDVLCYGGKSIEKSDNMHRHQRSNKNHNQGGSTNNKKRCHGCPPDPSHKNYLKAFGDMCETTCVIISGTKRTASMEQKEP